jgi:pimeloyl-ACP methyl ester carboxylesterase
MAQRQREVTSSDGVRLAVYESGPATAPTIVAVHGYPDNHSLWDDIAELLVPDFHVVTYDVRGAGASEKPRARRAYRMAQLVDDLRAVLEATSPKQPVRLVGHDWGSIQCWPALTDERFAGRIASFTSISGPSLDYAGVWLRQIRKHPRLSLRQFAHSYYIVFFQLPRLPELAARRGVISHGVRRAGGRPHAPGRSADATHGVQLYRANMLGRIARPKPVPSAVPVQLIVADHDPFATPELVVGATEPWVPDLTVVPVSGGHWLVSQQPDLFAGLIRDFAGQIPAASSSAASSSSR